MRKIFTFLFAALMSVGMFATTVTWNSSTLSSIYIYDDESFTQDGVTVTSLNGVIDGDWQGGSSDASFKFSTSLGNFTKIEITGTIYMLGGSGWTLTSPGAVWTGEANETTFGQNFENVSQIVFTIEEPEPEPEPAEVTVVFAANNKTVERTVTLPHTFKCSWDNGMDGPDELDIIIHELYNDYYYCNSNMNASGSDQVEVGTEEAPKNDYITIKGVFEGTATVTGDYFDWNTGEEGAHNYSITISIKGDEPQVERELTKLGFNFPSENIPADNDIEMAGTFEEGTMWMEKIIATGWFVSYDFVNAAEDETFKLRSKSNNDLVLCQFIPANDGEGGKWVQAIFTFGNYWDDDTWHGTPCKLIEKDLSDAAQYAWMEGMPEPQPTGIENIVLTEKAKKVIVDGMIYIVRDGKLFNLTGAEVR